MNNIIQFICYNLSLSFMSSLYRRLCINNVVQQENIEPFEVDRLYSQNKEMGTDEKKKKNILTKY